MSELERACRAAHRGSQPGSTTGLQAKSSSAQSAEAKVRRCSDDLVQANRLAILGQIAAGVAHEINQPVAAIRTYAENAAHLSRTRHRRQPAGENLDTIAAMTERIGTITERPAALSRKAARRG